MYRLGVMKNKRKYKVHLSVQKSMLLIQHAWGEFQIIMQPN